ncbi:hypothetical protein SCHPADRAFT_30608 [Schizopora paradoxa]|uniref:Uncharacterized protein n=1 Tax=Schizopora paradoxa TaxID=27342 RepID=A0A0H2SSM7_9AGAM|nr:hypothetical protein SCHPADRAFT_30608 [Schizopora paradoxa]
MQLTRLSGWEKGSMMRARLTVQHAHRYFTQALKLCDDLHGGPPEPLAQSEAPIPAEGQVRRGMGKLDLSVKFPKTGNGMFGRFGSTMKVLDYQNTVRLASMAQACLNECLRVLEPYAESIPEGQLEEDFKSLKKNGVLQMAQVYNLVFGGRIVNSGVEQAIERTLRQQETAFASLTRLAVWVQKRVPESEEAERAGLQRRETGRKEVAEVWKANDPLLAR